MNHPSSEVEARRMMYSLVVRRGLSAEEAARRTVMDGGYEGHLVHMKLKPEFEEKYGDS